MMNQPMMTIVVCAIVALVLLILFKKCFYKIVILQFQKGLLYENGIFQRVLEPGAYWLYRPSSTVTLIDTRVASVTIAGQEIITADNVGLKLSLLVSYQVVDPATAVHSVQAWYTEIYTLAQLAARDVLSTMKVDEIINSKGALAESLLALVKPKAQVLGVDVTQVQIKDLMFPADLRKAYSDLVRAQKEGMAALERARGEQAALRTLANAARMLDGNPALMNLRILQTLSGQGTTPPPTVVLGVPNGLVPLQAAARGAGADVPPAEQ
jgi:regulator of protease activity HflC (stomatin/prohibitin superfamily)